ncbi:MAG: hypothetical protein KF816_14940 [Melioribacteraceae bacterium]|nr:hypothetical protein [Melioribacteraceae bacterium]
MKTTIKTLAQYLTAGFFLFVLLTNSASAQVNCPKNSIETLKLGVEEGNEGVMRTCVYYAGIYKIAEAVPVLAKRFKMEKDTNNKILIALALYSIGNEESFEVIQTAAAKENDMKVKTRCIQMYLEHTQKHQSLTSEYEKM